MLLQAVCIVTTVFCNFVQTSVRSFTGVLTSCTSHMQTTLYVYSKQTCGQTLPQIGPETCSEHSTNVMYVISENFINSLWRTLSSGKGNTCWPEVEGPQTSLQNEYHDKGTRFILTISSRTDVGTGLQLPEWWSYNITTVTFFLAIGTWLLVCAGGNKRRLVTVWYCLSLGNVIWS